MIFFRFTILIVFIACWQSSKHEDGWIVAPPEDEGLWRKEEQWMRRAIKDINFAESIKTEVVVKTGPDGKPCRMSAPTFREKLSKRQMRRRADASMIEFVSANAVSSVKDNTGLPLCPPDKNTDKDAKKNYELKKDNTDEFVHKIIYSNITDPIYPIMDSDLGRLKKKKKLLTNRDTNTTNKIEHFEEYDDLALAEKLDTSMLGASMMLEAVTHEKEFRASANFTSKIDLSEAKEEKLLPTETVGIKENTTQATKYPRNGTSIEFKNTSKTGEGILNQATTPRVKKKHAKNKKSQEESRRAEYLFSSQEYYMEDQTTSYNITDVCPDNALILELSLEKAPEYDAECELLMEWFTFDY